MNLQSGDIILIIAGIVAIVLVSLYLLNRYAYKKFSEQNDLLEKNKQNQTIYIIDKKRMRAKDSNLPKIVIDGLPKYSRVVKLNLVKAKIGPQITTLLCDKKVFEALPIKKSVKVELAGIYIISMHGMKTKQEIKALRASGKETEAKKPWHKFLTKS